MPVPLSPDEARQFIGSDQAPAAHLDMRNAVSFRTVAADPASALTTNVRRV